MAKQNKAKQAGKVIAVRILTVAQRVEQTVGGFAEFVAAGATLENAKAEWDAARMGLRVNLDDAQKQFRTGKDWAAYLKGTREGLVAAGVVATVKAARTLVDNQLIALGLTGKTDRAGAGGKRKGAGRPEAKGAKQTTGDMDDGKMLALVVAYCRTVQEKCETVDYDPAEMAADILRILRAGK